jgi:DNA-binding MarR family transcriptional regulator
MPDSPAREAWSLMGDLFMFNRRAWVERFAELGLAPMQAFALRNLQPDTPMPMSTLAGVLHCDNSNITGIADRLEAAGLIERRALDSDRRVKTLALTERGVDVRDAVVAVMSVPPPSIASLSEEDARTLRDLLRRAQAGG